jgi:hypothetical protein
MEAQKPSAKRSERVNDFETDLVEKIGKVDVLAMAAIGL